MATRLPGAREGDGLHDLLESGQIAIGMPPADRWPLQERWLPPPLREVARNCVGGFLEDAFEFDARLFGVSPREARLMDPQQRLFLQMAWSACDDAGYGGASIAGTQTGVFAGTSRADYFEQIASHLTAEDYLAGLANSHALLANRVSSFFDLSGPSLTVDTLCSSSLAAVHLAVESLRSGACELALAGGVNFLMSARYMFALRGLRLLSVSGRSQPFRLEADGFVPAEGGAVLLLKRLPDALRDRDAVRAVILGSSLLHHGASAGLTVPAQDAMAAAVTAALRNARITPAEVSCVQAMGASNPLGDAAELSALARVYGGERTRGAPLLISCEKGSLGHLECASGVASLAAAVLSLEHAVHFPAVGSGKLPDDLAARGLRVLEAAEPRSPDAAPHVAVSSFGMTGTYVHLVLQAAAPESASTSAPGWGVLPLGAESEDMLLGLARDYQQWIVAHDPSALPDLLHTAAIGRWHGRFRAAVVAHEPRQFARALQGLGSMREVVTDDASVFFGRLERRPPLRASSGDLGASAAVDRVACEAAAQRFTAGLPVDWAALHPAPRRRIHIPLTRFQRQAYSFDPPLAEAVLATASSRPAEHLHPMLQAARRK